MPISRRYYARQATVQFLCFLKKITKYFVNSDISCTFVATVPV